MTNSSYKHLSLRSLFGSIRQLTFIGQAAVCKTFHLYMKKHPNAMPFFTDRFEETYSLIDMKDLEESWILVGYAVNDMDNAITEVYYNDPLSYLYIEEALRKVIAKEMKTHRKPSKNRVVTTASAVRETARTVGHGQPDTMPSAAENLGIISDWQHANS